MAEHRMARADLITGALLFVLAIAVIYGAWTMDRLEVRQIHPLSVPGLLPGILGLALAVTSLMLIVKAARTVRTARAPALGPKDEAAEAAADPGAKFRLLATAAVCLIYALGLVGRMPFWLATALFVAAFIVVFEWERGSDRTRRLRSVAWGLFLGLATGIAVSYVFSDLFLVRLP